MLLPDAGAVFIEHDVQRPMKFILNIPMLANHRDEDSGRPYEARNVDAIVSGNGSARVGRTNRFDDNHRLEARPCASSGRATRSVMLQTLRCTVRPCASSKASKKCLAVRQVSWCSMC